MSDIIVLDRHQSAYPPLLNQIPDPPASLYCRGNTELLGSTCFAIVGTRKITPYGKEVATTITRELAYNGFTIVSGLAYGIDAAAHRATLEANGRTIAVLGSAIDELTPAGNAELGKSIIEKGGLVISEYAPGSQTYPSNFAARNRIISGLSLGVLVIEADAKSGALITAQCALDQNRDVFAVPGSIFSPRSQGTHTLLKTGAQIATCARDILDTYGVQLELFQQSSQNLSTRNPLEHRILAILESDGPTLLDEMIRKADSDTPSVIAALSLLEIHGTVRQIKPGTYAKCNLSS